MNHASRRLSWNSTCGGFWLNRTAPDRSPLSEEHRAPSSGRMQPLLSEQMPLGFSLHARRPPERAANAILELIQGRR
jgi:hypothetical protein